MCHEKLMRCDYFDGWRWPVYNRPIKAARSKLTSSILIAQLRNRKTMVTRKDQGKSWGRRVVPKHNARSNVCEKADPRSAIRHDRHLHPANMTAADPPREPVASPRRRYFHFWTRVSHRKERNGVGLWNNETKDKNGTHKETVLLRQQALLPCSSATQNTPQQLSG